MKSLRLIGKFSNPVPVKKMRPRLQKTKLGRGIMFAPATGVETETGRVPTEDRGSDNRPKGAGGKLGEGASIKGQVIRYMLLGDRQRYLEGGGGGEGLAIGHELALRVAAE